VPTGRRRGGSAAGGRLRRRCQRVALGLLCGAIDAPGAGGDAADERVGVRDCRIEPRREQVRHNGMAYVRM
jgi:hypothetical protein